jgi:hypothetical protein
LLPLGSADGREDQGILVQQWHAGLIACSVRWIKREVGQEARAGRIAGGDVLKLQQIGLPDGRFFVLTVRFFLINDRVSIRGGKAREQTSILVTMPRHRKVRAEFT